MQASRTIPSGDGLAVHRQDPNSGPAEARRLESHHDAAVDGRAGRHRAATPSGQPWNRLRRRRLADPLRPLGRLQRVRRLDRRLGVPHAAATVSGQTIAILTAVLVVVLTVRRRYALPAILAVSLIAMLVTAHAFGAIESSGDLLLTRLDLIAETDRLNP